MPGQRDDEERDRLSNGWDLLLGGGPWALCWSGEEDYFYHLKIIILLILAFVLMMFARNTGTTLFSAGAISLWRLKAFRQDLSLEPSYSWSQILSFFNHHQIWLSSPSVYDHHYLHIMIKSNQWSSPALLCYNLHHNCIGGHCGANQPLCMSVYLFFYDNNLYALYYNLRLKRQWIGVIVYVLRS